MICKTQQDGGGGILEDMNFRGPGEEAGIFLEARDVLSDLMCLNP